MWRSGGSHAGCYFLPNCSGCNAHFGFPLQPLTKANGLRRKHDILMGEPFPDAGMSKSAETSNHPVKAAFDKYCQ